MKKPTSTSTEPMRLEGEIAAIDTGTHRLTLKVQEAGKTVERELVTNDHTKVLEAGKTVALSTLKVGEKVDARCHKDGTRMIASEVTVKRS